MRRVLIILVVMSIVMVVSVLSWRTWQDHAARRRTELGLNSVKVGMSRGAVLEILDLPTFEEHAIADPFTPSAPECKRQSASAFVYQSRREGSLVIFFDRTQHVVCVEQMMAFRIIRQ